MTATGREGAAGRRFAVVVSRFNRMVTERLADGARDTLVDSGADLEAVDFFEVPGAWELPWAVRRAARSDYDAVVALGCVVRGETPHFDYICEGTTRGLMEVAMEGEVPVTFGVLTCDTLEQALARSGGEAGDKGAEAAEAAVELCRLSERLG